MTQVTWNEQSFAIDGQRLWLVGATLQYARIPPELWAKRLAAVKQAGFNTIETACPWTLHEPRPGRFWFEGAADVKRWVRLCDEMGFHVILRAGPFVGSQFDGGGLPAWLVESPGVRPREASELFLERTGKFYRKLFNEVGDLQVTKDGPVLLVQIEHGWRCANAEQGTRYLNELMRIARESGIAVPLLAANDLWQDIPEAIDIWSGWDDLLVHCRQLRTVQLTAPRMVNVFHAGAVQRWGSGVPEPITGDSIMRHVAEVLAAGAQPIVRPFHGGTNFSFNGGRVVGNGDQAVATGLMPSAPLGEAGARGDVYRAVRRIASFASHFGHVFTDLNAEYHPIGMDLAALAAGKGHSFSIVPVRGTNGRVAFVFGDGKSRETSLVLDDGLRMPVNLGDQTVGWYVFDADLGGRGKLDYCNLCPFAIVDRRIVVLYGPAKSQAYLSVSGTPMQTTVPAGKKPQILRHRELTFVICNESMIDVTFPDEESVYIGIDGFDEHGEPQPAPGYARPFIVVADVDEAEAVTIDSAGASRRSGTVKLESWTAAPATAHVSGKSPRFASLDGPGTLAACGAGEGYGWYRLKLKVPSTGKRVCHLPGSRHRVHMFLDGEHVALYGEGPGAVDGPFELRLVKGEQTLVALVDNFGRFADGNDVDQTAGLNDHLFEVKPHRAWKPKDVVAEPVDPFTLRGYLASRAAGQLSDVEQAEWTFSHAKKLPIVVEVKGAHVSGTFVLNDIPIHYYAGENGAARMSLVLDPVADYFRRGKNVLRFAPDPHQKKALQEIARATLLYECTGVLSEKATWSFGKWESPTAMQYKPVSKTGAREHKGAPCWWRSSFETDDLSLPLWFDTTGLSKGQIYLNDHNVGRYFTSTSTGKAVGPQKRLYLPEPWVHTDRPNEIVVFDEHGCDPSKTKIVAREKGEFE